MKLLSLPEEASSIFRAVKKLREQYPGLSFTPDGHLPGHIGVVIADKLFKFKEVMPDSTPSCDAIDLEGNRVEIKATGRRAFAFRKLAKGARPPDRVVAIKLHWDKGNAELIYNGLYTPIGEFLKQKIDDRIKNGKSGWPNNGQHMISIKQLHEIKLRAPRLTM